jgi:DNA-binding MarR family transcriptional regulator
MAAAGLARTLPDGRVLRICATSTEPTISKIGRELGISRQGASKLIAGLSDGGYVTLRPSPADGREKLVELTPRAIGYLEAQRTAAQTVQRGLRAELGADGLERLLALLEAIGGDEQPRMSDYLRKRVNKSLLAPIDESMPQPLPAARRGRERRRSSPRGAGRAPVA